MNRQDARAHRNTFTLALYRLRHLLDEPTSEERLRTMYELGRQAYQRATTAIPAAWRNARTPEPEQTVFPLLSAPAPNVSDVQKRIQAALEKCTTPSRPGELVRAFRQAGLPTAEAHQQSEPEQSDWLNSKPDVREELFADVVDAPPAEDEESDETIMTESAKKRQTWRNAMSQLLPPVDDEKGA